MKSVLFLGLIRCRLSEYIYVCTFVSKYIIDKRPSRRQKKMTSKKKRKEATGISLEWGRRTQDLRECGQGSVIEMLKHGYTADKRQIILETSKRSFWKCNFHMVPHFRLLVSWLVGLLVCPSLFSKRAGSSTSMLLSGRLFSFSEIRMPSFASD